MVKPVPYPGRWPWAGMNYALGVQGSRKGEDAPVRLLPPPASRVGVHGIIRCQAGVEFPGLARSPITACDKSPGKLGSSVRRYLATLGRPEPIDELAGSGPAMSNLGNPPVIICESGPSSAVLPWATLRRIGLHCAIGAQVHVERA